MADNVTGGPYGSSDIGFTVGVQLGNIDNSIEDAATLAENIKQWREDNEAFIRSLSDTKEALSSLTNEFQDQLQLRQQTVEAEQQLRDISAEVRNNIRDTISSYQQIGNIMGNLTGAIPGMNMMGIYGMGMGMGYPSVYNGFMPGMMGAYGGPRSSMYGGVDPDDVETLGDELSVETASIAESIARGAGRREGGLFGRAAKLAYEGLGGTLSTEVLAEHGIGNAADLEGLSDDLPDVDIPGVATSSTKAVKAASTLTAEERAIRTLFSLPGWGLTGRLGATGRYINRMSGGRFFASLARKPWLTGTRTWSDSSTNYVDQLFRSRLLDDYRKTGVPDPEAMLSSVPRLTEAAAMEYAAENGITEAALGPLQGGLLGLGARVLPIAGATMVGLAAAKGAYDLTAGVLRQGQEYRALTGDYSIGSMLGTKFDALRAAGFGFNPYLPYEVSKEISLGGLAAGYRGSREDQYREFGRKAFTTYGIGPQESQALFETAVVRAGMTVGKLNDSLDRLANTSSKTSIGMEDLRRNFLQSTALMSAQGFNRANNGYALTSMSEEYARSRVLQGSPLTRDIFGSIVGESMVASQLGVPLTEMFSVLRGTGSKSATSAFLAGDAFIRQQLQNIVGVDPSSANFERAVDLKAIQLMYVLNALLPPQGDEKPWTQQTAVAYTKRMLRGQAGMATGMINSAQNALLSLSDNKSINTRQGMNAFWENVRSEYHSRYGEGPLSLRYEDSGGQTHRVALSSIDTAQERMKYYQMLAQGSAQIGLTHGGRFHNLGQIAGNSALSQLSQNRVDVNIALQPGLEKLFKISAGNVNQHTVDQITNSIKDSKKIQDHGWGPGRVLEVIIDNIPHFI